MAPRSSVDGVLGTGDHKTIGRLYIAGGVFVLIGALVLGIVAVFYANNFDNLAADGTDLLPQMWSLSRDLALFGGIAPIMVGIALYSYGTNLHREIFGDTIRGRRICDDASQRWHRVPSRHTVNIWSCTKPMAGFA